MVKVILELAPGREHHFDKRMKVGDILKELQLNSESVIVIRNNQLLTKDEWVGKDDEIRIRGVISGG